MSERVVKTTSCMTTHEPLEEHAAVFRNDVGGYPFYRIPALLRVGTTLLLAFAEGRGQRSDHGRTDIVMRRSFDDGSTWSPMSVVHTELGHTIGNPAPLYDEVGDAAVLIFCRDNEEVLETRSIDGGLSWSVPMPISWSRPPEWKWVATGPPASLVLRSGRWLVPCDGLTGDRRIYQATTVFSFVLVSDDRGETWRQSALLEGGNECQAAEFAGGEVLLNMRSRDNKRLQARSADGGATWSDAKPAKRPVIDGNAQGSIIALHRPGSGGGGGGSSEAPSVLLATSTGPGRRVLTARSSSDGGQTWQTHAVVEPAEAAYSSLIDLGGGHVGCLYETKRESRRSADEREKAGGKGRPRTEDVLRFARLNVSALLAAPAESERAAVDATSGGSLEKDEV